jgi:2-polyprenyl-3-methyl-5-hydroxy-6-metoxy-1,4-benzoquinol methylase
MKKVIKDRHDYIKEICNWKKVLHIWCIGNSYKSKLEYEPWLHKEICDSSKECIWVDLFKERIEEAEKLSWSKIFYWNAQDFDLWDKFDVIVAWEIIEHLDNFVSFFDTLKKHSNKDTIIVLTTPNVFNFSSLIRILFTWKPIFDPDHVVYFDEFTLWQMLKRHWFEVEKFIYNTEISPQRIRNIIIRWIWKLFPILNLNLMVICKLK